MLRSMTGFGAAAQSGPGFALRVEARSVNHRHLLVKTRLANEFAHLEPAIEERVRKALERGALTLGLEASFDATPDSFVVRRAVARSYRGELAALARELGIEDDLTLSHLVGLPGVVGPNAPEIAGPEGHDALALELVDRALLELCAMRAREGRAVAADLEKHVTQLEKLVARVEKRMPAVVTDHQKALTRRVQELLGKRHGLGAGDLAREIALLADRLDVSEEVSRLASHLAQFRAILDERSASGRKLEFLVQEILREVNTIGSKASDARVAHWIVEAKTLTERLREQVQNVE